MSVLQQKQLEELLLKISEINLTTSLDSQLNDLKVEYDMEDMNSILSILNKIDKKKIKKILSVEAKCKDSQVVKNRVSHSYTPEEIKHIFSTYDITALENKFSRNELEDMYISLNNIKPLTSYKKQQIINDIYLKFLAENRTKKLHMSYSDKNKKYAIS